MPRPKTYFLANSRDEMTLAASKSCDGTLLIAVEDDFHLVSSQWLSRLRNNVNDVNKQNSTTYWDLLAVREVASESKVVFCSLNCLFGCQLGCNKARHRLKRFKFDTI